MLLLFATVASTICDLPIVEEENVVSYEISEKKILPVSIFEIFNPQNTILALINEAVDTYIQTYTPKIYFEIVIPPPDWA